MRIRSLNHTTDRSGATARRVSVVTLAAAVVIAPVFAAAPAFADASVVTEAAFPVATLSGGGYTQAYFNGNTELTEVDDFDACYAEYKNGTPYNIQGIDSIGVPVQYDFLYNSEGFVEGDVYAVSFFDSDPDFAWCDVAPALTEAELVTASLTLGAPTPAPTAPPELPASAAALTLTQGVAFDQTISISYDAGFDFSGGGWITAGPQSSAGLEDGELYPLDGIIFEYDQTSAGAPVLRAHGTPKYAGAITTGFQVSDFTSVGGGPLVVNITGRNGTTGPISIETAIGQPVSGAAVTVIASGLLEGAAWDVTVRSTPIIVGSGTIGFGGQLATTVNIPAGLAAGAHSITLSSTNADGSAFSSVLYFTVSASGALAAVSITEAGLPDTGADVLVPSLVAGGLLLAGLAFTGVTVYRRRRSI